MFTQSQHGSQGNKLLVHWAMYRKELFSDLENLFLIHHSVNLVSKSLATANHITRIISQPITLFILSHDQSHYSYYLTTNPITRINYLFPLTSCLERFGWLYTVELMHLKCSYSAALCLLEYVSVRIDADLLWTYIL